MKRASDLIRVVVCTILIGLLAGLLGCSAKMPQGKYTEEEMQNIPLANRYDLPDPTGGMTLRVGSETLTADEVLSVPQLKEALEPLAKQGNFSLYQTQAMGWVRGIIRNKVADMLLYSDAVKNAPEKVEDMLDAAVKKEVERFVASYDNNLALAEQELKKMGMDWRSFRDFQKKMIMTQSYISSEMNEEKKYTRSELLDYYSKVRDEQFSKPGKVQFQLIELDTRKLDPQQVQEGETREQAVRRLADEILRNIDQGQNFGEMAKEYSKGPLASLGGMWAPVTVGSDSLAAPYNVLEPQALKMEPGTISGPIEAGDRLFILRLVSKTAAVTKSFDEVQDMLAAQLEFQDKNKIYNEMVEKVLKRADLVEMERFAQFCIQEGYKRWSAMPQTAGAGLESP